MQAYTKKSTYPSNYDFWWGHHGVIFPGFSNNLLSVFVYIPIQVTFTQIFSMNVVLFNGDPQQLVVSSIFRVYGSVFGNPTLTKLSLATYPYGVSHPNLPLTSTWDYSASGSGCINSQSISPGLNSDTILLPSNTYTIQKNNALFFRSDVSYNDVNGCQISQGNNENDGWGELFAIYYNEPIFEEFTMLNWSYSNNQCMFHNFNFCSQPNCSIISPNYVKTLYSIICSTDSENTQALNFGNNGKVTISYFKSPFYWGQNYPLFQTFQYIWSNAQGVAVLIQPETNNNASTWLSDACSIQTVTGLPQNAKDAKFLLSLQSTVEYQIPSFANLTIQHIISPSFNQSNINVSFCYHNILQCSISSEGYYILQNQQNVDYLLTAEVITLQIYIDTPDLLIDATHSAYISYNGYNIEQCSSIESPNFHIDSFTPQYQILLQNLQHVNMRNAQGAFSFTFMLDRVIRPEYDLRFNMDIWLSSPSLGNNFRCFIMNNGDVSNDWMYLKLLTSDTLILKSKNLLQNGGIYDLKCISVTMYDILDSSNYTNHLISVILERNIMMDIITTSNLLGPSQNLMPQVQLENVTLEKTFGFSGFEADYTIYFSPVQNDISLSGRLYIEFSNIIPPKLNTEGAIECFINNDQAICEIIEERTLKIYPTFPIKQFQPCILKIMSVTQPDINLLNINSIQMIYFALYVDDDLLNGVSEFTNIEDNFNLTAYPSVISTWSLLQKGKLIRNYSNLTYLLNIPANTLIEDSKILWIKFPLYFGISRILDFNQMNCSFTGLFDNFSLVKSCMVTDGRRIRVDLNNDSTNNQDKVYIFVLQNISTPQEVPNSQRVGLRMFITDLNIEEINSMTDFSNRYSEVFLNFNSNPRKTELIFQNSAGNNDDFSFNIGYFNENGFFLRQREGNNFNQTINITILNTDSYILDVLPKIPQIMIGSSGIALQLAGDNNISQGVHILKASFENGNITYSLPNFLVVQSFFQLCSINVNDNYFDIPYNGISNLIVIDFSGCIPETQIMVSVNLTLTYSDYNISLNSNSSFDANDSPRTLKMYFSLNSSNNILDYNQIFIPNVAFISFNISGVNIFFYNEIPKVFINLTPDNKTEPVPFINDINDSILTLGCDKEGKIYYVFGLGESAKNTSLQKIINETENNFIELTEPLFNDSFWIIYGFSGNVQQNQPLSISLSGKLKADEKYTLFCFCSNINKINTKNPVNFSWIQPDNGGKNSIISIGFNNSLTSIQKNNVSCAIARIFSIRLNRVWIDEGTYCNMTSPPNKSGCPLAIVQKSVNFNYDFLIPKNYKSSFDDFYLQVNAKVNKSEFINQLLSLYEIQNFGSYITIQYSFLILQDSSHYYNDELLNVSLSTILIDSSSINVTLQLNSQGYILAGISNYNSTTINSTTPTVMQLFLGYDGMEKPLMSNGISSCQYNEKIGFYFGNLSSNQSYALFYAGSNLDSTPNSVVTRVNILEIKTQIGLNIQNSGLRRTLIYFLNYILIFVLMITW